MRRRLRHQSPVDDDEEEDEETLQLKLAALEAKLKLKKLQQKKNLNAASSSDADEHGTRQQDQSSRKENLPPTTQGCGGYGNAPSVKAMSAMDVQIPSSPQRKRVPVEEAHSPGRVLLGIDKGLKGKNVSLRRPQGIQHKDDDPFRSRDPPNSVSRIAELPRGSTVSYLDQGTRVLSFSAKIAETRQQDRVRKENAEKLHRQRSTGFGVQQQEIDALANAVENKEKSAKRQSNDIPRAGTGGFSRDEVLKAVNKPGGGLIHRSNTSAGIRRARAQGGSSCDIWTNPNAPSEPQTITSASKKRARSLSPAQNFLGSPSQPTSLETADSLFEPFSSLHLSKRLLPHDFLTRTFSEKHIFILPSLLGSVKSPDFLLPEIPESDHVVLGIIASKSPPLNHKSAHKSTSADSTSVAEAADSEQNANGKYMVLTLTDLKWTLDFFLFTTAYTRFRKLTPGTVVALLNPDIMPPPPGRADTGRFSLKLASSDDTVLEIGTSRDLGWCKSVRKDGKQCGSWIDKRHTEFCEFHVDVVVERNRRGRMEVQGMSAPFAPGGRKGGRTGYFGDKKGVQKPTVRGKDYSGEGAQYDRGCGSRYFVGPSIPSFSAAQLLDAEGTIERGGSREDRLRRRLADREKEKEIARKLGEGGNGAGSEYLRLRHGLESKGNADPQAADPVDATSLGLLGNQARDVHLSPIKKRKRSTLAADSSRKKTRFVTERGIKEAGRESVGGNIAVEATSDDDEDGLEVV